jgi:hypothetical protein
MTLYSILSHCSRRWTSGGKAIQRPRPASTPRMSHIAARQPGPARRCGRPDRFFLRWTGKRDGAHASGAIPRTCNHRRSTDATNYLAFRTLAPQIGRRQLLFMSRPFLFASQCQSRSCAKNLLTIAPRDRARAIARVERRRGAKKIEPSGVNGTPTGHCEQ